MTSLQLEHELVDRSARARKLKAIALPVEHGGWGLTLEPVLAGLIVSFSLPGLAIGIAIIVAFLARQPLRIVTRTGRHPERFRIAMTVVTVEAMIILSLALVALSSGALAALLFLVACSPLAVFLLWRDRERRSRDLVAELAAAVFMSCAGAAIVIAGGGAIEVATALGVLVAARSVGAVLHVRERVHARRGREASRAVPIGFHVVALMATLVMAYIGVASLFAVLAFLILLGRTVFPVTQGSPSRLGWGEVGAGLVSVALISLSLM